MLSALEQEFAKEFGGEDYTNPLDDAPSRTPNEIKQRLESYTFNKFHEEICNNLSITSDEAVSYMRKNVQKGEFDANLIRKFLYRVP